MTHVLIIYEIIEPTNRELCKLMAELERGHVIDLRSRLLKQIEIADIDWCDVVISVRSTSVFEYKLAELAKKLGKFWILELDDDFLSLGDSYGRNGEGYPTERKKYLRKILPYTDCILTANKLLAEKYCEIGKISRYVLLDTVIDPSKLSIPTWNNKKKKVAFYVNDGTLDMFNMILKPALLDMEANQVDKFAIYFLGLQPDVSEFNRKLEFHFIPHMGFEKFLHYLSSEHFDIGLAPLTEDGFSQLKYFNKYIEYTRAGIVGIYSDCALYRQIVVSGSNGILCDNSPTAWRNAILSLVSNNTLRKQLVVNAQNQAREKFALDTILLKLRTELHELADYKAQNLKAKKLALVLIRIQYRCFRLNGWLKTFFKIVRAGNFQAIPGRISRIINRKYFI